MHGSMQSRWKMRSNVARAQKSKRWIVIRESERCRVKGRVPSNTNVVIKMVVNHSHRSQLVSSSFFNVPTDWHWHSGSVKTCKGIVSSRVTRHDRATKKVQSKIVPLLGSNWRTRNKGSLKSSLHAHNSCRNEPSRWANTKDSFKRSFPTLFSVHLPMEQFQMSTFSARFATMVEI